MFWTQYLASILFSTLWGFLISIYWWLFLCLPIICETILICFCFFNLWILTPWVYFMNFYGRRPVRFSGAVSLISWTCCSWDALYAIYVACLDVIGFWLLLCHSLLSPSFQLVDWALLCPLCFVCCCVGAVRFCWNWFFWLFEVISPFSGYCSVLGDFSIICLLFLIGPVRMLVRLTFTLLPSCQSRTGNIFFV